MPQLGRFYHGYGHAGGGNWINLHATDECNLRCSYCYLGDKGPREPSYDPQKIVELVRAVPGSVTICFFGGEPTLNIPFMEKMVAALDGEDCHFAIQTNGTRLATLPTALLERFIGVGVSVDGAREVTDAVRGKGVYDRVIENVASVRDRLTVPVMARMTLIEANDLARDVDDLMAHFDAIYWQIDNDLGRRPHEDFQKRYVEALPKVLDLWEARADAGAIKTLIPIFGTLWRILEPLPDEVVYFPCGAGGSAVSIDSGGTIYSCPEGVFRGRAEVGGADIITTLDEVGEGGPYRANPTRDACRDCDVFHVCGGRCIWTDEALYCACTKALVSLVSENAGRLLKRIGRKGLEEMLPVIMTTELVP